MATMFDDVDAVCPFYKRSDRMKIVCESTGNYGLSLAFDNANDRNKHKQTFCDSFEFGKCMICQINERNCEMNGEDIWWK